MNDATSAAAGLRPTIRWGGVVLTLCAMTLVVTMLLYLTAYGAPAGSSGESVDIANRAAHLLAHEALVTGIWIAEAIAWVLVAMAALALMPRTAAGPAWLPTRVAWGAVLVGALVQLPMFGIMLGGYWPAAGVAESTPALLDAMNASTWPLFQLGGAVFGLGLGGVFLGERGPEAVIPTWTGMVGGLLGFVAAALFLGGLLGMRASLTLGGPVFLLLLLLTAWLGVGITRQA